MMGFTVGESRLINRNVVGMGGRTSMRLEPELWDALDEIARREGMSIAETIRVVELAWAEGGNAGGRIVAAAPPEEVVRLGTHTGVALARVLAR